MTEIKTDMFHWVVAFHGSSTRDGDMAITLADQNNNTLAGPALDNLSEEERRSIEDLNLFTLFDIANDYSIIICTPKESKNLVTVTAPLYIKEIKAGKPLYRKGGTYTDIWTDPRDIQWVCEFITSNIPSHKISKPGCYVDMKDI